MDKTNDNSRAIILALTAIFLWSTAATAFKLALKTLDFIQLLWIASLISTVVLFTILLIKQEVHLLSRTSAGQLVNSALLGFLNPFLYYFVLLKAYSMLPAQIAQPLNYTWPIMLVLLSIPILGKKINPKSIFAIILSFAGVVVIASQGDLSGLKIENPTGVILATGSSVVWALFWLYNVRDKRPELVKLFYNFAFGFLLTTIAMLLWSTFEFNFTGISIYAAVYVGFFEMSITFAIWLTALRLGSDTALLSNLVFISPFLALIFIHFILGETIFMTTFAGIILIIGGIFIQQYISKNKN